MYLPQIFSIDVRVDLGRRNIGMAEHLLNRTQIRTVAEQVRRKSVAQNMRADAIGINLCRFGEIFQQLRKTLTGQVTALRGA